MANFKLNYTGQKVNELLDKAAKSIDSSDIEGLASENYVDNAINNLDIPVVDSTLDLESTNAIANKSVATALCPIDRYNVPLIDGQYGGQTWASQLVTTGIRFYGIAYGNGTYVVVGQAGKVFSSSDGTTWKDHSISTAFDLDSVAYGNGVFVVVGKNGLLYYSNDGASWTGVSSGTTNPINRVIFENNKFIATSYGRLLISSNGINWETILISSYGYNDLVFGNNLYVFVSASSNTPTMISTDLLTFTYSAIDGSYRFTSVAYGNGIFVAVGNSSRIYTSTDGLNWVKQIDTLGAEFSYITFAGNQFVAVCTNAYIYTSKNGIDWVSQSYAPTMTLYYVCAINYTYFVTGYVGASAQSYLLTSDATFNANGLSLPIPLTEYETNKIVNIKAPMTLTNTQLNINSLGAKTINGTIEQGKNYELVYNGSSWDIKTDNTIFKKQEIVFGETIFNNQKQFTCFIIGLLKNNSDLKIILPNSEYILYTQEEGKEIKVITTDTTISVINNTDNTENIIYRIIE